MSGTGEGGGLCAANKLIAGRTAHYCREPKGHEPHWHHCSCGHWWRPE